MGKFVPTIKLRLAFAFGGPTLLTLASASVLTLQCVHEGSGADASAMPSGWFLVGRYCLPRRYSSPAIFIWPELSPTGWAGRVVDSGTSRNRLT